MAWNEPGNNNRNNDPWGNNGNRGNQGPPDLDKALKKLGERLNSMLGGDGSGSGNGLVFLLVALAGLVYLGLNSVYIVDQTERAVVLRLGQYVETQQPGIRFKIPLIDNVELVNVTRVRQQKRSDSMLTEDENIVDVSLSVQYIIGNPKDFVLNVKEPELSLSHAVDSAIRHVVGSFEMHQVLTEGRQILGDQVKVRLQEYLDNYGAGLLISEINIESTQAPKEVQAAFDDVIKAREDEERVKNEAEAYSNGIIPEARGFAQRVLEEANAYKEQVVARAEGEADRFEKLLAEYNKAPEVTRERLYLEAMSNIFSKSNKVLVDLEGGNNMMYLPIDKLVDQAPRAPAAAPSSARMSSSQISEITDQVVEQILQRQLERRTREGR